MTVELEVSQFQVYFHMFVQDTVQYNITVGSLTYEGHLKNSKDVIYLGVIQEFEVKKLAAPSGQTLVTLPLFKL